VRDPPQLKGCIVLGPRQAGRGAVSSAPTFRQGGDGSPRAFAVKLAHQPNLIYNPD